METKIYEIIRAILARLKGPASFQCMAVKVVLAHRPWGNWFVLWLVYADYFHNALKTGWTFKPSAIPTLDTRFADL